MEIDEEGIIIWRAPPRNTEPYYAGDYKKYLKSDDWKHIKKAVIRQRGYECEKCFVRKGLELHHKHYDFEFGKERDEDLILLCKDCHKSMH